MNQCHQFQTFVCHLRLDLISQDRFQFQSLSFYSFDAEMGTFDCDKVNLWIRRGYGWENLHQVTLLLTTDGSTGRLRVKCVNSNDVIVLDAYANHQLYKIPGQEWLATDIWELQETSATLHEPAFGQRYRIKFSSVSDAQKYRVYHERSRLRTRDIYARLVPLKKDGAEYFDVHVIDEAVLGEKDDFPIEGDAEDNENSLPNKTSSKTSIVQKINKIKQRENEKSKQGEWLGKLDPNDKKPSTRKDRNTGHVQQNKVSALDLLTDELQHSMILSHHGL